MHLAECIFPFQCTLSQVDCPPPRDLVVLLGLYLVPLSGTSFSAVSFCLKFYLCFYVCGSLVMFLTLEKWPSVGNVLCVPEVHSSLTTQQPGTSWSQGRFWPVFKNSVPNAVGLCTSFFWRLPPGGWGWSRDLWRLPGGRAVDLGLGTMVGRAVSGGV